eukprot:2803940-Alexandrium_andersonii.AAC.1
MSALGRNLESSPVHVVTPRCCLSTSVAAEVGEATRPGDDAGGDDGIGPEGASLQRACASKVAHKTSVAGRRSPRVDVHGIRRT